MSDFFKAVVKMREAQKRYFRVRSQSALTEAKEAEEEVDAMIRQKSAAISHPLLSKGYVNCEAVGVEAVSGSPSVLPPNILEPRA